MIISSPIHDVSTFTTTGRGTISCVKVIPSLNAVIATNGHMAVVVHKEENLSHFFPQEVSAKDSFCVEATEWKAAFKGSWAKERMISCTRTLGQAEQLGREPVYCSLNGEIPMERKSAESFPKLSMVWQGLNNERRVKAASVDVLYLHKVTTYLKKFMKKAPFVEIKLGSDEYSAFNLRAHHGEYSVDFVIMPVRT